MFKKHTPNTKYLKVALGAAVFALPGCHSFQLAPEMKNGVLT